MFYLKGPLLPGPVALTIEVTRKSKERAASYAQEDRNPSEAVIPGFRSPRQIRQQYPAGFRDGSSGCVFCSERGTIWENRHAPPVRCSAWFGPTP